MLVLTCFYLSNQQNILDFLYCCTKLKSNLHEADKKIKGSRVFHWEITEKANRKEVVEVDGGLTIPCRIDMLQPQVQVIEVW